MACLTALALAPAAGAHEVEDAGGTTRRHAAEHLATARAKARFDRLSPARQQALRERLLQQGRAAARRAAADGDDAATVGRWTSAPFAAPDYAIHAVMMQGGRVLLFSMGSHHGAGNNGQGLLNDGQATIWDPSLGEGPAAFKSVDPPPIPLEDPQGRPGSELLRPAPIFCAGQVQLADGRILIAGGNLDTVGAGLKILFLFDPVTETWVREPNMTRARWYPTLTRLPSGRVAILGGHDEARDPVSATELYPALDTTVAGVDAGAPLSGLSTSEPKAQQTAGLYPHAFVLPSGRLSLSMGGAGRLSLFEPTTGRWVPRTTVDLALPGSYPTSFLRPGGPDGSHELVQAGGLQNDNGALTGAAYAIDPERETAWRTQPSLNVPRRNSTSVLLPDGTAMVVNGGRSDLRFPISGGAPPSDVEQRRIELWDPASGNWRLGPAAQIPRGYHSIGLLLADGRVLSAGDDWTSYVLDVDRSDAMDSTFEIYSPPYLFRGARPQITSAPSTVGYRETLSVTATSERAITRATLVAPGSVTHAIDMNQRLLELPISKVGEGYVVTGPTTSAAAPPGDYMLFLLTDQGVPSVASWVRIRPSFPGQGTPLLTPLSGEARDASPTPTQEPEPVPGATATVTAPPADAATPPPSVTPPVESAEDRHRRLLGSASSAIFKGRRVQIVAILAPTGAGCPAKVSITAAAGRQRKTVRVPARRTTFDGAAACRATASFKFAKAVPAASTPMVRVFGTGVATLHLKATRPAAAR